MGGWRNRLACHSRSEAKRGDGGWMAPRTWDAADDEAAARAVCIWDNPITTTDMKLPYILSLLAMSCALVLGAPAEKKYKEDGCCDKAQKAGGKCEHPCCVKAEKDGKVCEK